MTLSALIPQFVPIAVMSVPQSPVAEGSPAPVAAPLVTETDHAKRGTDLEVTVPADKVVRAAQILDKAGYTLEAITGVDWIAEQQIEVVYDYALWETGKRIAIRTRIPRDTPALPTISMIYPGANWHERETHDFFGVDFTGHPDMSPLLLPEDATFHPLRKDYGT
jgi:NADH-quinone oxidoreductase subunit C